MSFDCAAAQITSLASAPIAVTSEANCLEGKKMKYTAKIIKSKNNKAMKIKTPTIQDIPFTVTNVGTIGAKPRGGYGFGV